jgi:hypothetical protein
MENHHRERAKTKWAQPGFEPGATRRRGMAAVAVNIQSLG